MSASEHFEGVRKAMKESFKAHALLRRAVQALSALILPLFAAAIGILVVQDGSVFAWSWKAVQITCLVIAAAGGVALLVVEDKVGDLLVEVSDLEGKIKGQDAQLEDKVAELSAVEEEFGYATELYETSRALSEIVDPVFDEKLEMVADRDARLKRLLNILVERKQRLFGMGEERWNFSIYVWDNAKQQLVCRACRRWSQDSENQPHREWGTGDGHVGLAFKNSTEVICRDSSDASVAGLIKARGNDVRDYDAELYRSLASIPILSGGQSQPLGVVVATSDVAGRFVPKEDAERDSVEALRALASVLATLLRLTHLKSGAVAESFKR